MKLKRRNSRGRRPHSMYGDDPFFGSEDLFKDLPGYAEGEVVTVFGPADGNFEGPPKMRPATLDDVQDDCPECRRLRRRIEAGEQVIIADFSRAEK